MGLIGKQYGRMGKPPKKSLKNFRVGGENFGMAG